MRDIWHSNHNSLPPANALLWEPEEVPRSCSCPPECQVWFTGNLHLSNPPPTAQAVYNTATSSSVCPSVGSQGTSQPLPLFRRSKTPCCKHGHSWCHLIIKLREWTQLVSLWGLRWEKKNIQNICKHYPKFILSLFPSPCPSPLLLLFLFLPPSLSATSNPIYLSIYLSNIIKIENASVTTGSCPSLPHKLLSWRKRKTKQNSCPLLGM